MKKLIYIPIVHNQADLGSLGSQLSSEGERKYGTLRWRNHIEEVDKAWENIEQEISLKVKKVSFDKIKIYQDGLPVAGEIGEKIVRDTARNGSKNYAIIERLLNRGARLELAEDKELLLKEYYLLSDISKADNPEKQLELYLNYQKVSSELLVERDRFIANQINTTLQDGEIGIAFFGAAHTVPDKIIKGIKVEIIRLFRDEISVNLMRSNL